MVKKIKLIEGNLSLQDKIDTVFEKIVTKFGTGAKIDAPKNIIGKKVYILVQKD